MSNSRLQVGAVVTSEPEYVIDFERGFVTHSYTMDRDQFTRYMRTSSNKQRWDLNARQAQIFYDTYLLG